MEGFFPFYNGNIQISCPVCRGEGNTEIGSNEFKDKKTSYVICPLCHGTRFLEMERSRWEKSQKKRK